MNHNNNLLIQKSSLFHFPLSIFHCQFLKLFHFPLSIVHFPLILLTLWTLISCNLNTNDLPRENELDAGGAEFDVNKAIIFSPKPGTYNSAQSVTISTPISDPVSIKYTMDGAKPACVGGTEYKSLIAVNATTTIKAIICDNGEASSMASATYTLQADPPTFNPAGGTYTSGQSVTISTASAGATIKYTADGTNPTCSSGLDYSGAVSITQTTTIKAVACIGTTASSIFSVTYTLDAQAPTFSPAGGTYTSAQSVTISTASSGATIKYTTNGTNPTCSSGLDYSGAVSITQTMTLKVVACIGTTTSSITSATYTLDARAPIFNPAGGLYISAQSVTISTTSSGAVIKYTTDGTNPTCSNGLNYSGAVSVTQTTTIKAVACIGTTASNITSATFTLDAQAPTFNPAGGMYTSAQSVTISTASTGATIKYTVDGTNPTCSSGLNYSGAVSVTQTTTIKAVACIGTTPSSVMSAVYTFCVSISGNYCGLSNNTVIDTANNLIWKKCSQGQNNDASCSGTATTFQYCTTNDSSCDNGTILTSGPAYTTCNTLNTTPVGGFASRTTWRVPTMTELKSLVYGSSAPYIDQSMFPSTVSYYYWSSTPHYGGSFAYGVDFGDGNPDYYAKVDILYVRCVSP